MIKKLKGWDIIKRKIMEVLVHEVLIEYPEGTNIEELKRAIEKVKKE